MKLKSIFNLSAIARLSLGIISMVISLLMIGDMIFGVFPDKTQLELDKRKSFAESLSVQLVVLLESGNDQDIARTLQEITIKNPIVRSIGIRRAEGWLAFQKGNHDQHWAPLKSDLSTINNIRVPIYSKQEVWGNIEINFKPQGPKSILDWLTNPTFLLILAFGLIGGILVYIYLRRAMHYLNPSVAVPGRVQKAFDILADGILVLDKNGYIVLANRAFKELNSLSEENIYGRKVSDLSLIKEAVSNLPQESLPWHAALTEGAKITETPITLAGNDEGAQELIVSSESISDNKVIRGCLVNFKNVTELQKTNMELTLALDELKESRALIEKSNDELQVMASRDPLTGCLNRRAFFQQAGDTFKSAAQGNRELYCIMADIDHFKSFNDIYGHYIGDQVIQIVAKIFNASLRPSDLVCRYGGEEFCILLSDLSLENVNEVCERMRKTIEETGNTSIRTKKIKPITMSFGIASISDGITTLENLIDFADNALYLSKETGRNRVTVWENPELL